MYLKTAIFCCSEVKEGNLLSLDNMCVNVKRCSLYFSVLSYILLNFITISTLHLKY